MLMRFTNMEQTEFISYSSYNYVIVFQWKGVIYSFPSIKQNVFAFLNDDRKCDCCFEAEIPGVEINKLPSSRVSFVISKAA